MPPYTKEMMAVATTLGLSLALGACSKNAAEPPPGPAATAAASATSATSSSSAPGATTKLALAWDDPPRWKRRPPSSAMRAAEYLVPRAPGDSDDAECLVITFGPTQGGSVDDNVDRWVKQFEGGPAPSRTTRSAHGMKITRVDVTGTYTPMRMPSAPAAPSPHTAYRLAGAIVEAPSGFWFFKVTGPEATVKAAMKELDALVDSSHPAG